MLKAANSIQHSTIRKDNISVSQSLTCMLLRSFRFMRAMVYATTTPALI